MLNCETVVFRLFNGGDSTVRIMPSRMGNYSVIMISEWIGKPCWRISRTGNL